MRSTEVPGVETLQERFLAAETLKDKRASGDRRQGPGPCLVIGTTRHHESAEIITSLAARVTEFS